MNEIEDTINKFLNSDTQKNALDFVAFLRANDMIVSGSEVSYQDKIVCYLHIDGINKAPGPWTIWTEGDYSAELEDVTLDWHKKEIAWANVNICVNCGCECAPGIKKVILAKNLTMCVMQVWHLMTRMLRHWNVLKSYWK
ncbi:MAG: hypothetical protein FWG20_06100 [Candidatus Cloacimonetes bacterium]|nr:hypothetical protein [Candidatus Cloacimonadota bacterium]